MLVLLASVQLLGIMILLFLLFVQLATIHANLAQILQHIVLLASIQLLEQFLFQLAHALMATLIFQIKPFAKLVVISVLLAQSRVLLVLYAQL